MVVVVVVVGVVVVVVVVVVVGRRGLDDAVDWCVTVVIGGKGWRLAWRTDTVRVAGPASWAGKPPAASTVTATTATTPMTATTADEQTSASRLRRRRDLDAMTMGRQHRSPA